MAALLRELLVVAPGGLEQLLLERLQGRHLAQLVGQARREGMDGLVSPAEAVLLELALPLRLQKMLLGEGTEALGLMEVLCGQVLFGLECGRVGGLAQRE